MFGISFAEFLIILLIAILVIPVKDWPNVARFLAKIIKSVKNIFAKVSESMDDIKEQIDLEKPIDELIKNTTGNFIDSFSAPIPKKTQMKKSQARTLKRKATK